MRRLVIRLVAAPLVGVVGALAWLALDRSHGLSRLLVLREEVAVLEGRLARVEEERDALLRQAHALRSDPLVLEGIARRKLGMVRPGELVIRLGEPDPRVPPLN